MGSKKSSFKKRAAKNCVALSSSIRKQRKYLFSRPWRLCGNWERIKKEETNGFQSFKTQVTNPDRFNLLIRDPFTHPSARGGEKERVRRESF
jgi:hypothetical protein